MAFQSHESQTLATALQNDPTGPYFTGIVGKYLNGYGSDPDAPVTSCLSPTYMPQDGWDRWHVLAQKPQEMLGYTINDEGFLWTAREEPFWGDYQTTQLEERAVDFINQAPGSQPFFLFVAPTAPHIEVVDEHICDDNLGPAHCIRSPPPNYDDAAAAIPLPTADPFNEADVDDKPLWLREQIPILDGDVPPTEPPDHIDCTRAVYQDRLESLQLVDEMIGAIGTALYNKFPGGGAVLRNTVVFVTSDNGYFHGEHRLQKKVPPYEESLRVPLVVRDGRLSRVDRPTESGTPGPAVRPSRCGGRVDRRRHYYGVICMYLPFASDSSSSS